MPALRGADARKKQASLSSFFGRVSSGTRKKTPPLKATKANTTTTKKEAAPRPRRRKKKQAVKKTEPVKDASASTATTPPQSKRQKQSEGTGVPASPSVATSDEPANHSRMVSPESKGKTKEDAMGGDDIVGRATMTLNECQKRADRVKKQLEYIREARKDDSNPSVNYCGFPRECKGPKVVSAISLLLSIGLDSLNENSATSEAGEKAKKLDNDTCDLDPHQLLPENEEETLTLVRSIGGVELSEIDGSTVGSLIVDVSEKGVDLASLPDLMPNITDLTVNFSSESCSCDLGIFKCLVQKWTLFRLQINLCENQCQFWNLKDILSDGEGIVSFSISNFHGIERFEDIKAIERLQHAKHIDIGISTPSGYLWDGSEESILDLKSLVQLKSLTFRDEWSSLKFKAPEEDPGTSRIQLILPQQPISLQFEWSGSNPYAGLTSKLRKKLYGDITKRTREFVCSNLSGEKVRDEMSYARLEERKESNKLRAAKRSFDSHHRMHDMERAGLSPARDEDVSRGDQVYVFTQFTDGKVIEFSPMTVGDQSIVASGDSHGELGDDEESMLCVEDRMTSWRKVWMEKYPKEFKAYGSLNCYPPGGLDLKPVPRRLVFKTIPAMTGYEESGSGTGSIFLLPRESDEKTDRISPCPVCGGLFTRKALSSHLRVMKDSAHVNYLRQGMHV